MLNLDTHVLLHAVTDTLRSQERALLSNDQWSISAIVLWEIAKLAELKRIDIDLGDPALLRLLEWTHVWPISLEVCRAISSLDFKSDPADELIAATSVVHDVPLVTRDRRIRTSKLVPFA